MKICIIGGIFGKPAEYQDRLTMAPEAVLLRSLTNRGHEVVGHSHLWTGDLQGFDVVHVHHLSYGAVAAASDISAVPLVFTGHWMNYGARAQRWAARYVLSRSDAVIALSHTEAAWQRSVFGLGDSRQRIIPNGIDAKTFTYSHPTVNTGEVWKLLYVGQLVPFKCVNVLLESLALLQDEYEIQLDLVYHVAEEEHALRDSARRLGLGQVRFLGTRGPRQLSELYDGCHILVLPSCSGEALPSVISEALVSGRPVVATNVGAVSEQVGDFGRVVAPGDARSLAAGIDNVLADYDSYAERSRVISDSARNRYSLTTMVDAHVQLYKSLITPHPSRRHTGLLDLGAPIVRRCIHRIMSRRRPAQ